ncbi:hypothetical protein BDZ45DRAFT_682352 [Acephala macrosclerotiorum]|nr:hypothetical protein BDZ45DRAFT_682352 [Acephala macrosclerotiorum]
MVHVEGHLAQAALLATMKVLCDVLWFVTYRRISLNTAHRFIPVCYPTDPQIRGRS